MTDLMPAPKRIGRPPPNRLKSDATMEELRTILTYMESAALNPGAK
jgi:hypothetical protein